MYHRDVCANGFIDDLDGKADAVFLDLPAPHDVVPYALKSLKSSGNNRNCIFILIFDKSNRQLAITGSQF